MKLIQVLRSANSGGLFHQLRKPQLLTRAFSTNPVLGNEENQSNKSFESADAFEQRMFGGTGSDNSNSNSNSSFFQKFDRLGKSQTFNPSRSSEFLDGLDDSFNTLSDGLDGKLKRAATYFEYDVEEIEQEDYTFRADKTFRPGMTYETKDLDLTKKGARKTWNRVEFETTTEEVLRKADFRNVRFLANFLTESGIIIKRSMTGISAKAQRKIAREIKTARAFGLLPFTTMGTKHFEFGKTMEELDEDYQFESSYDHSFVDETKEDSPA